MHELLKPDRAIYGEAMKLSQQQQRNIDNFDEKFARYSALQQQVDQSCKFQDHEFLVGKDCYDLEVRKDGGVPTRRPSHAPTAPQLEEMESNDEAVPRRMQLRFSSAGIAIEDSPYLPRASGRGNHNR